MERRTAENSTGVPQKGWNSFELSRMLEEGFEALTADQRTTLHLAFFEGRSMREIAERLGATFANVRHHYYRGLQKLRLLTNGRIAPSKTGSSAEFVGERTGKERRSIDRETRCGNDAPTATAAGSHSSKLPLGSSQQAHASGGTRDLLVP